MVKNIKQIYVISHTHWDREWYLPFEKFRMRLINLIDNLLDILGQDSGYKYFMLDGQTVVLEDYLKIKPENEQKLKYYIRNGRILIGPWYVLSDEFLASPESHIRNLLLGDKLCKKFGSKMAEGYLPDSFGHIAQMPQILKGFNIESAILWRGIGDEVKTTEFIWEAPDGSEVLTVHMPYGYCTGGALSSSIDDCVHRIKNLVNKLAPLATTDILLLMNGCDHLEPQSNLPQILTKINERLKEVTLLHSTLPVFIKDIRKKVPNLPKFRGEWRSGDRAVILSGTLSTRMYLKQFNHRLETLMEKWVEPFSSFSWIEGRAYSTSLIWQIWKYILQNQAHDSICGCCVDEVHREMINRYTKVEQVGEEICRETLRYLAQKVDTSTSQSNINLVVFNPLQYKRTETIEVVLDVDEQLIRKVDWEKGEIINLGTQTKSTPRKIEVYDSEEKPVACYLKRVETREKMKLSPYNLPQVYIVNRYHLLLHLKDVPGLGYTTYSVILKYKRKNGEKINSRNSNKLSLENEYFKVTPHFDGSLAIYDKQTGKTYEECNVFLDEGDAGDEYTYSPPRKDKVVNNKNQEARISWEENNSTKSTLKIETYLSVPLSLTKDRKTRSTQTVVCPIVSYVSLYPGIRRIDIKTEIENKAKDHRLRVLFPSEIQTSSSYAEGHFQVMTRNTDIPKIKVWMEKPMGTYPQRSFVDVNDGKIGLTIANRGLPEYEVIKENGKATIALTLLRCVGWLSRGDLLTRKGQGGWSLPTPEAQCLGKYTFHYSIIPHSKDWEKAKTYIQAHNFNVPLRWIQIDSHPGNFPRDISFFQINPDNLIVSAIKKSEDSNSLIVRVYNTSSSDTKGTLYSYFPLKKVNFTGMDEQIKERLEIKSNSTVGFFARAWKVITLQLIFEKTNTFK